MDRVLLIIDDIQYNRQVEMSLRKVGFEVESVNSEFNINEPLLSFNPDYIIVRGNSSRLNVLNVGKKLKETNMHFGGKVILVFPKSYEVSPDDLFKIKADIILNDPISTLRLVVHLISLTGADAEFLKEKLLKFAVTDAQYRMAEQQILKQAGLTIDSEIDVISNSDMSTISDGAKVKVFEGEKKSDLGSVIVFKAEEAKQAPAEAALPEPEEKTRADAGLPEELLDPTLEQMYALGDELKQRLSDEIQQIQDELELRIETYNRAIKDVDQDLKKGLKKRQTRKEFKQLHKDLIEQHKTDKKSEADLDKERIRFTKALFKKN